MPGRRDALALGELGGGDAGVPLDLDEQGHLTARHPEGVNLAPQLAREAQQHGAQSVREVPLPRAADSFVVLIINLVNYSNDV